MLPDDVPPPARAKRLLKWAKTLRMRCVAARDPTAAERARIEGTNADGRG